MAAITVTTELDDLRVLFNQMDEIYYKSTPIASTDIATSLTVDMEWPVLEDGVSFDTGAADVTEIKLTTQAIWTTKAVKGDADISFQVASIKGTINDVFMDKVKAIASTSALGENISYEGAAYKLSPKKIGGALVMFSEDKTSVIILPNIEAYANFVAADGDNPAYFNVSVKPLENSEGASIFILEKSDGE